MISVPRAGLVRDTRAYRAIVVESAPQPKNVSGGPERDRRRVRDGAPTPARMPSFNTAKSLKEDAMSVPHYRRVPHIPARFAHVSCAAAGGAR